MDIFSKKVKYYTKKTIKLTSLMALGVFIIIGIMLLKMKPVYQISMNGEMIGYVQDKNQFEERIDKTYNDNQETNIAFADFDQETNYEFKLVDKAVDVNEEEVLSVLDEHADITYFQYAILVNGEERQYVLTSDQANEVVTKLNEELGTDGEFRIQRIYTKKLNAQNSEQTENISNSLVAEVKNEIQEEQRRQKATINGVYIAVVPVSGNVTSRYGDRESIRDHDHRGLDIAAKTGTPIKAAASGTISYSGTMSGYGNLIIINHGNGITTYYGHCSKLYKQKGETVKAGDVIAAVGSTGNSTGSHLHFEIRKNDIYVNPAKYLF